MAFTLLKNLLISLFRQETVGSEPLQAKVSSKSVLRYFGFTLLVSPLYLWQMICIIIYNSNKIFLKSKFKSK